MDIRELATLTLSDLIVKEPSTRSPGLHLSTIIQDILRDLDPRRYGGDFDWNRVESGTTFERVLERELMARNPNLVRPGEFHLNGIACSPDGWDPIDRVVEEYKWTWKSSRYPITDDRFWPWAVQIKGYCHVVGTTRARLRVFFVNGDYSNFTPELRSWLLTFTEQELRDNWLMVLNHARHKGLLPPPGPLKEEPDEP